MYNRKSVAEFRGRLYEVRDLITTDANDHSRRTAVKLLREIATELDCLKPVEAIEAPDPRSQFEKDHWPKDDVVDGDDHAPIPAAPGLDYATQKQLDTTRISLVNMIHASQDEFLALVGRVEMIEKALAPKPYDDCRSGVAMSTTIDQAVQGRRIELYNQAFLAALPAVIRLGHSTPEVAYMASDIAARAVEYLK